MGIRKKLITKYRKDMECIENCLDFAIDHLNAEEPDWAMTHLSILRDHLNEFLNEQFEDFT